MSEREPARRIVRASLESLQGGRIELASDWEDASLPPIEGASKDFKVKALHRVPPQEFGKTSSFWISTGGELCFALDLARLSEVPLDDKGVYVCGPFNGWTEALNKPEWRLHPETLGGWKCLVWRGPAAPFLRDGGARFKFATGDGHWFEVPWSAPNLVRDDDGNRNHRVTPGRTGRHLFDFTLAKTADLSGDNQLRWKERAGSGQTVDVRPGAFFFRLRTDAPLGALVENSRTVFRVFAPRARTAEVAVFDAPEDAATATWRKMRRTADGCWELALEGNQHGRCYYYRFTGPKNAFSAFDPAFLIADPWALALVDSAGPALVVDRRRFTLPQVSAFATPAWPDLVIAEAHVRDLAARAPIAASTAERRGFTGLRRWVEHRDFHLARLGVNAVELQPIQEFDNKTTEEYHWGYMTVNFFAPESSYALDPRSGSQVQEFRDLVDAFHKRGQAVLLDVVYNHCGEPNFLHGIDKLLYFDVADDGTLVNWSGCGNDTRCASAMMQRLIIESCTHLLLFYGVDGFRFDLAELVGADTLREVETALKRVKPSVVLIAEPWSFRGHIAGALQPTGWASWNDGYRDHLRSYVWGHGAREATEYFVKGSPWYFARFPAQTVNYTESHDDRTWIDMITEVAEHNGFRPTADDQRRSHLMFALLFASVGIPMLSAGQDFLRSKRGVNNTYLRGDLNALDYHRLHRHATTHSYVAHWIHFRRSEPYGRLLRHHARHGDGFFRFVWGNGSSFAATYNADGREGRERLLFAINPHPEDTVIELDHADAILPWRQVCDTEAFLDLDPRRPRLEIGPRLWLPGLSCAAWVVG